MTIAIWTGGQTGVDTGAALAALDMDAPIGGFMPADGHNEAGQIPAAIAMHLTRHNRTNPAARTRANVATSDAALVIVRDRRRAGETRGTALTIRLCEERQNREPSRFKLMVIDPTWDARTVGWLIDGWPRAHLKHPLRLLVAGPRASLWPDGEAEAKRIVWAVLAETNSSRQSTAE